MKNCYTIFQDQMLRYKHSIDYYGQNPCLFFDFFLDDMIETTQKKVSQWKYFLNDQYYFNFKICISAVWHIIRHFVGQKSLWICSHSRYVNFHRFLSLVDNDIRINWYSYLPDARNYFYVFVHPATARNIKKRKSSKFAT